MYHNFHTLFNLHTKIQSFICIVCGVMINFAQDAYFGGGRQVVSDAKWCRPTLQPMTSFPYIIYGEGKTEAQYLQWQQLVEEAHERHGQFDHNAFHPCGNPSCEIAEHYGQLTIQKQLVTYKFMQTYVTKALSWLSHRDH